MAPRSASITPLMTLTTSVVAAGGCRLACDGLNSKLPGVMPERFLMRRANC